MASGPDYAAAAAVLRLALEDAADALATADLDRLLACEARLDAAVTHLPARTAQDTSRATVLADIDAARAALTRCRRLGAALSQFVELGLSAQGFDREYSRNATPRGAALHTISRTA